MKNKVLVKVIVPELDASFDLFIPVNEVIWKINILITQTIFSLIGGGLVLPKDRYCVLFNKDSGEKYNDNDVVIKTNIRNGSELILYTC